MEKFRKWLDNYWYHYKWQTLIALLFIVTLLIGLWQCVFEKQNFDVYLLYVGPEYIEGGEHQAILDTFESLASTTDFQGGGDGSRDEVNLQNIVYMSDAQIKEYEEMFREDGDGAFIYDRMKNLTAYQTFQTLVAKSDNVIMFLDPALAKDAAGVGAMFAVKDMLGDVPGITADGFGVDIYEAGLPDAYPSLKAFPEGTVMCLCATSRKTSASNVELGNEKLQFQLEVAKNLVKPIMK